MVLLVLATAGLGTIGVASVALLRTSMIARMDDQLRDLAQRVDGRPGGPSPSPDDLQRQSDGLPTDFAILVLHDNGTPEPSTPVTADGPVLPVINSTTIGQYATRPFTVDDRRGGAGWRVLVSRRTMPKGRGSSWPRSRRRPPR